MTQSQIDQELICQLFFLLILHTFLENKIFLKSATDLNLEGLSPEFFFNNFFFHSFYLKRLIKNFNLLFAAILSIFFIACLSRSFFHRSLDVQCDFWKLIQLHATVYEVCMQELSILWSSSTCPFTPFCFWFCVQIHVKTAFIDSMFLVLFFFFRLPNLEDCKPAVWRHLISCVCLLLCWATKDYIHYKLSCFCCLFCFCILKKDVLLNCPACWTCMVSPLLLFFLCLKMSFISSPPTPLFFGWLQHGIHNFI